MAAGVRRTAVGMLVGTLALLLMACGSDEHQRFALEVVDLPAGACPGSPPVTQVVLKALGDFAPTESTAVAWRVEDGLVDRPIPLDARVLTLEGRGSHGELLAIARSQELPARSTRPLTLLYVPPRVGCLTHAPLRPRARHTATLLADGRVLIAGGITLINNEERPAVETELYDPETARFTRGPDLYRRDALLGHTATRLSDGRVLVFGGETAAYQVVAADGTSASPPSFLASSEQRAFHAAVALPGAVLLIAGCQRVVPTTHRCLPGTLIARTLRYDERTGALEPGPSLERPRFEPEVALRPDGLVLVSGGLDDTGQVVDSIEILDPGPGGIDLGRHVASLTTSMPGRLVLLPTGGAISVGGPRTAPNAGARLLAFGERSTRTLGALSLERAAPALAALEDGSVVVSGGLDTQDASEPTAERAELELYHPDRGSFEALFGAFLRRSEHTATRLADGSVLLVGGRNPAPGIGPSIRADAELVQLTLANPYMNLPLTLFGAPTGELVTTHPPALTLGGPARLVLAPVAGASAGVDLPLEAGILAGPTFDRVTVRAVLRFAAGARAAIILSRRDEARFDQVVLEPGQAVRLLRVRPVLPAAPFAEAALTTETICVGEVLNLAAATMVGSEIQVVVDASGVVARAEGRELLRCSKGAPERGAVGIATLAGQVEVESLAADR